MINYEEFITNFVLALAYGFRRYWLPLLDIKDWVGIILVVVLWGIFSTDRKLRAIEKSCNKK